MAGVVALAATTACISCTDTWDEHYDINLWLVYLASHFGRPYSKTAN